jgi:hypothetical protein
MNTTLTSSFPLSPLEQFIADAGSGITTGEIKYLRGLTVHRNPPSPLYFARELDQFRTPGQSISIALREMRAIVGRSSGKKTR